MEHNVGMRLTFGVGHARMAWESSRSTSRRASAAWACVLLPPLLVGSAALAQSDAGLATAATAGDEAIEAPEDALADGGVGTVSERAAIGTAGEAPVVPAEAPVYPQGYAPPPEANDYGSYPAPDDYGSGAFPDDTSDLEGGPGAREHDGFFLRLSIGPGAGRAHYKESIDDLRVSTVEASGLAGMFDLAVGGRVVGNLIVHGNLMFSRFDSPTRRVDGVKDAALHVASSSTLLGAGASYYFMPLNVYLSASLGMAWAFERRAGDQLRTGTGVFVALAAGKEWWVGRSGEWGLGAALRTTFMAAPIDMAGVESTLKLGNIGVAFSATFN